MYKPSAANPAPSILLSPSFIMTPSISTTPYDEVEVSAAAAAFASATFFISDCFPFYFHNC